MCLQLDHPTILNTSYNGQCTSGKLFKLKSPVCQNGRKLFSLETCNYICSTNFFKDLFSKAKLDASPRYLMYSLCRPFYSLYSTKEKLFLHSSKPGMLAFALPSDHLGPGMKKKVHEKSYLYIENQYIRNAEWKQTLWNYIQKPGNEHISQKEKYIFVDCLLQKLQ